MKHPRTSFIDYWDVFPVECRAIQLSAHDEIINLKKMKITLHK